MVLPLEFDSDNERNEFLLYHYLNKTFLEAGLNDKEAEERTDEMFIENSSNLFGFHGLAWQLGKFNLEFFCLYFLQDIYYPKDDNAAAPHAKVHEDLWKDIQEAIIGEGHNQLGRILPRGTGKSVFGNTGPVIWVHAYGHIKYTLICSDIGSTAEKFIADIKNQFLENELLKNSFGVLLDDRDKSFKCNTSELELTNFSKIEAIPSASPMRGRKYRNRRPELIILDDYQSESDVKTHEAREGKWKRFSEDVKFAIQKPLYRKGKLVKKGTVMIALGTLQHKECFYSRLMNQPTWKFENEKGVLIDNVDKFFNEGLWLNFKEILFNSKKYGSASLDYAKEFYYQHQDEMQYPLLWQEFWDCLDMAIQYYENPSSFKQEVQGDVDSIGEKWFKTVATEKREEIERHDFIKTMLLVDPAATNNKKSDYSAFLVGSKADNNLKYARKAELARINARTDFDKYVDHMIELIKEYIDITHVYIEKNTFNGADANLLENKIKADLTLRGRDIEIINEAQRKNKDDKISTIIPYMNKGQIIFAEEDDEFISQILDFRGQKFSIHDDAPDIASEFNNRIDNIEIVEAVEILDRRFFGL
ncbi:MAG: hypothetical protein E6940_07650 [Clostridium septicum]|uniref:hypothetical protein n=1 Tax=Clostridium septicum TaxID=1504 RepID=UPI00258C3FC6|nr:hypothetical protein [Clostridium septicum]MDU1313923.1 hypothetical protein [Clostridium septicum]